MTDFGSCRDYLLRYSIIHFGALEFQIFTVVIQLEFNCLYDDLIMGYLRHLFELLLLLILILVVVVSITS